MERRKTLLSLIVVVLLILTVVGLSIKYSKLSRKYYYLQNNINITFKSTLSLAAAGFAVDFDSLSDENSKQYNYNESMANLASSSQLVEFTTYNNKNLGLTLYSLYKLMEQNKYRESVIEKSKLIYENLLRLLQNPEDKEATDNIIKLTEEIRRAK